ncbi:murein L,D-transpeptidase catalytic domain family protein [soil metagenome]
MLFYFYGFPFIKAASHVSNYANDESVEIEKLKIMAVKAKTYCIKHSYNKEVCILIDMSLPSGKNRFFEYDLNNNIVISSGLIAHGSCNYNFLTTPEFSNEPGCGCTALGKYKVGEKYKGRFGVAYKLYGLDSANNNAWKRKIVLHSYYMIPDKETYPLPICNSLGCAMISTNYLSSLSKRIDGTDKPILLWIFTE